jgi:hypothetical protein
MSMNTPDDIYTRTAEIINRDRHFRSYTRNEIVASCERAREDGIAVQSYAKPETVARMLTNLDYLQYS